MGHRRVIGDAIRRHRTDAALSMRELARRSGVSQPLLSMIENGKSAPSIVTLYRVAEALGVTPQELLGEPDAIDLVVVRRDDARVLPVGNGDNPAVTRFLGGTRTRFEAYDFFDVRPGQDLGGEFVHEGVAFVIVIAGSLEIAFADGESVELAEGDCAYYRGSRPHRWTVVGRRRTRVVMLIDREVPASEEAAVPLLDAQRVTAR
jgi:transcriptional regulator with XRE-family HTH domain